MEFQDFKNNFSEQLMEEELTPLEKTTLFRQLASWDSLTAMAIRAMIEDEYLVKITDQEFKDCLTIGDIFELVKAKQ